MKRPWIAAIIVATILIVFRIFTASHFEYANFAPVAALLFCGAAFWKTNKWILPTAVLVWLVSWPMVSAIQGYSPFHTSNLVTIIAFGLVAGIGYRFAGKSFGKLIFGTLLSASAFYFVTNTVSLFTNPVYAKTLNGYIQCMWTGSPLAQMPTWVFFRNSLIGNALGTSIFIATMCIPAIKQSTAFRLRQHDHAV